MAPAKKCRFCASELQHTFVDLGMSPLANSYVSPDNELDMEPFYPLHAYVCQKCLLVQLLAMETSEHIFSDYALLRSQLQDQAQRLQRAQEAELVLRQCY